MEALKNQDYRLAIRLYYLKILQSFKRKGLIEWKKDKTNNDYLKEVRQTTFHNTFRKLTGIFERIWYGKGGVNKTHFDSIEGEFKDFVDAIDQTPKES